MGCDDLFSCVDPKSRVPADHPLRAIRVLVNEALVALSGEFALLYSKIGRPSIAPEKLLRALLLQVLYTVRSERQLRDRAVISHIGFDGHVYKSGKRRKIRIDRRTTNSKAPPEWAVRLAERRPANVATVALVNKTARTIWALPAHDRAYRPNYVSQPA